MDNPMIFFDVDGTIFRYEDGIRPLIRQGIAAVRQRGCRVVINTGRARGMLPESLNERDFDGFITGSGSRVEYEGRVLFEQEIQEEIILRLLKEKARYAFTLETEDFAYMTGKMAELQSHIHASADSQLLKFRGNKYVVGNTIGRYCPDIPVGKICFMAETRQEADQITALLGKDFFIVTEHQKGILYGEAVPQNCGKGNAVLRLCKALSLPPENTIAFGDGQNDLDMLKAAGTGVAMGNGAENVKAEAAFVCPSIGEDGVYHGLVLLGLLPG